jgi:hypothetical protein
MFLLIEGNQLVNLQLMSRVELHHSKKTVSFWNAGVMEGESSIGYTFFTDPANQSFLMAAKG